MILMISAVALSFNCPDVHLDALTHPNIDPWFTSSRLRGEWYTRWRRRQHRKWTANDGEKRESDINRVSWNLNTTCFWGDWTLQSSIRLSGGVWTPLHHPLTRWASIPRISSEQSVFLFRHKLKKIRTPCSTWKQLLTFRYHLNLPTYRRKTTGEMWVVLRFFTFTWLTGQGRSLHLKPQKRSNFFAWSFFDGFSWKCRKNLPPSFGGRDFKKRQFFLRSLQQTASKRTWKWMVGRRTPFFLGWLIFMEVVC